MKFYPYVLLLVCLLYGCSNTKQAEFISVNGERFTDPKGRTVILNGINHVTKVPENRYLNDNDELLFRQFRDWGFNCIRYGIYWNALEPEPGKIDESYLNEIDKRVKWARDNNLWLILDMHQDLFSTKFGDGAPLWATIDEGLPHATGSVWSDAYTISPALQKSFDNFWDNAPAPDGIGIQDHYVKVWKTLAKRYADKTSVIGFDLMNEPFMGSLCGTVMYKFLESYAKLVALQTGKILTENELVSMWYDETKKMEILNSLNDKEKYAYIVLSAEEALRSFEEKTLSGFYQRLRDAIRETDPHHILFLEHNVFCNLGIKSSFQIPVDAQGNKDTLCAYAPHGYDLVTDTRYSLSQSFNRLDVIFDQIFQTGKEKGVPVLMGEWGAFYMGSGEYLQPTRHIIERFEQELSGQTYWEYWEGIETQDYFPALSRFYPAQTNGKLLNYSNDYDAKQFVCEWEETNTGAPTRIYTPDFAQLKDKKRIRLVPESDIQFIPLGESGKGYIEIQALGGKRSIAISLN